MGQEYITRFELPEKLRCPECGSKNIKIYGAKKVEYVDKTNCWGDVETIDEDQDWDVVYGVECADCSYSAEPDDVDVFDEYRQKREAIKKAIEKAYEDSPFLFENLKVVDSSTTDWRAEFNTDHFATDIMKKIHEELKEQEFYHLKVYEFVIELLYGKESMLVKMWF